MRFYQRDTVAAKAMAFSAAIMAFFYLFEGLYFLVLGIQKSFWQAMLLGILLVLYGSFRSYRNYQRYRKEKIKLDDQSSYPAGSKKNRRVYDSLLAMEKQGLLAKFNALGNKFHF